MRMLTSKNCTHLTQIRYLGKFSFTGDKIDAQHHARMFPLKHRLAELGNTLRLTWPSVYLINPVLSLLIIIRLMMIITLGAPIESTHEKKKLQASRNPAHIDMPTSPGCNPPALLAPLVGTLDVADAVVLAAVVATIALVLALTTLEDAPVGTLVLVKMVNGAVAASVVLLPTVAVVDVPSSQESASSSGLVVFVSTCKPSHYFMGS